MNNEFTFTNYRVKFNELFAKINREGKVSLLEYLEQNHFFTCPSSSQYHGAQEGGNLLHSIKVTETALKLMETLAPEIAEESVIICGLFHDLGKATYYRKPQYIENILKGGKRSDSKPYTTNSDRLPIPHQVSSLHILSKFIPLTEDEAYSILFHNALYTPDGRVISGKETPLLMITHWADMWASRFIETGYSFNQEGDLF